MTRQGGAGRCCHSCRCGRGARDAAEAGEADDDPAARHVSPDIGDEDPQGRLATMDDQARAVVKDSPAEVLEALPPLLEL